MKPEELIDAIGELPEDLLAPVDALRKKKQIHWIRWSALAAACLLILLVPFQLPLMRNEEAALAPKEDMVFSQEESPENEWNYGALGDAQVESFRAEVLEVGSGWILVKPLEGEPELRSADKIVVHLEAIKALPEITVGNTVEIFYTGGIQETYPAQISNIIQIRVV